MTALTTRQDEGIDLQDEPKNTAFSPFEGSVSEIGQMVQRAENSRLDEKRAAQAEADLARRRQAESEWTAQRVRRPYGMD